MREDLLIFTYVRKDFLDGVNIHGSEKIYEDFVQRHRVWHHGIEPEDVNGLLSEFGWSEREQVGRAESVKQYLQPTGRDLPVTKIERFVYADKL